MILYLGTSSLVKLFVAEEYALRGFDALHLASYLDVLERAKGEAVKFSAFDSRLNAAADSVAQDAP